LPFRSNAPLTLGEVADVRVGSPPPIEDAIINDVPGILLIVEKQPSANTLEVTRNVEAAMLELAGPAAVVRQIWKPCFHRVVTSADGAYEGTKSRPRLSTARRVHAAYCITPAIPCRCVLRWRIARLSSSEKTLGMIL